MANIVSKKGKGGNVRGWEVRTKIPTAKGAAFSFYVPATAFELSEVQGFKALLADCEKDIVKTGEIQPFTLGRLAQSPILDALKDRGVIDATPFMTLGNVIDEALDDLEQKAKPRTVKAARVSLRYALKYFKPETPISEIKRRDAQAFNAYLGGLVESGEIKQTTKNGIITRTKWVFNWLVNQTDETFINPFQGIKGGATTSEKEPRIVTEEEAARIEAVIMNHRPPKAYYNPTEWLVYFRLGFWQGLRLGSEAPELKWEFIDLGKGTITIKDVKRSQRGKATQWRTMPLYPKTAEALSKLKEERKRNGDALNYVFSDWWRRGNDVNIFLRIVAILKNAGLESDRPRQVLRQTASNRVDNDWGGRWEQNWIGHSESVARKAYLSKDIPQNILDKIREPVAAE